jgi:hypothetical protein
VAWPFLTEFDSHYLYWIASYPPYTDGGIYRVSAQGGDAEALGQFAPAPGDLRATPNSAFVVGGAGLLRIDLDGGSPTTIGGDASAFNSANGMLALGPGVAYWTDGTSSIRRDPQGGASGALLSGGESLPEWLVFDGLSLYWINNARTANAALRTIADLDGSAALNAQPFGSIDAGHGLSALATDAHYLYFQRSTPSGIQLAKLNKRDTSETILASSDSIQAIDLRIAVDATHVYFAGKYAANGTSGIFRVPRCGGAPPVQVAELDATLVTGIVLDEKFVYWSRNDFGLWRAPK